MHLKCRCFCKPSVSEMHWEGNVSLTLEIRLKMPGGSSLKWLGLELKMSSSLEHELMSWADVPKIILVDPLLKGQIKTQSFAICSAISRMVLKKKKSRAVETFS